MTKGPYIIGGIGLIGCLSLGFAMRQLAEATGERDQSPFAVEVEAFLGPRLRGRLDVRERAVGDRVRVAVTAAVESGLDLQQTAQQVGEVVWRASFGSGVRLASVDVTLRDGVVAPFTCAVAEPARRR